MKTEIEIGVPLAKTCKGLLNDAIFYEDDYPKTYWVWLKLKNDCEWFLASLESDEQYYAGYSEDRVECCYPAPQMHEILMLLPKSIDSYLLMIYNDLIAYENPANEILISCKIENNHYTESLAKLYLKLKKEDLL